MSKDSRRNYSSIKSFVDFLFLLCMTFAAMWVLSFVLIRPEVKSEAEILQKAEYLIRIEWDVDDTSDVDLYVRSPLQEIVYFQHLQGGLVHLERDDTGNFNDAIKFNGVEMGKLPVNEEVTTIRGNIPGEWTVNIHMYSDRNTFNETEVTVQLVKINPFKKVTTKKFKLNGNGDEITAFRFILDHEGNVVSFNDIQDRFARPALGQSEGGNNGRP